MTHRRDDRRFSGPATWFVCLLLGALSAAFKGQDAIWDLKNYHLYNAWAALHGRLAIDLAPAGLQSFFNPLLDLPYFLLGVGPLRHLPWLLAAFQGLWYGALILVLLRIAVRMAHLRDRPLGAAGWLAVIIGATGTMAFSQAGTSSNELPLAVLVLLAIYLLLPLCGAVVSSTSARRALLAGFACGLAAGLKPTAVVYPPALGLGLLAALGWRGHAWRMTWAFAAGAFIGFVLAYGWWGWQLWQLTGNPVFPMFNQVFHSSWLPPVSGTDRQFMPRSLGQWLFYPFYWIGRTRGLVTEPKFADARYAIELLAAAALVVTALWRRQRPLPREPAVRLLLVFVVTGYLAWLVLFSILRYAVPLEALSGLLLMLALRALPRRARADGAPRRWPSAIMLLVFLLLAGFSRYPSWGHATYARISFDIAPPKVPPGSLVLVLGSPDAYVIPFIDQAGSSQYVGLTAFNLRAKGYRLDALVRQRIADRRGAMFALLRGSVDAHRDLLQPFLPAVQLVDCRPVRSALEDQRDSRNPDGLRLCRITSG